MPTLVDKILNSQSVQLGLAGLAFLIALWLVIVIARMLMGGRLRLPGGRTRQARLGIVDAFDLDRQRQLIIIRRDNTEHLIMIGGPNDLVIEPEIVRVEARDYRDTRRDKVLDGLPDVRIPAPGAAPTTELHPQQLNGGGTRQAEPLLPMPLPQTPPPEIAVPPGETRSGAPPIDPMLTPQQPRAPTFPLPPRRPAPAPLPERRPPPLPERATRAEDPPLASGFGEGQPLQQPISPGAPSPVPTPASLAPGTSDVAQRPAPARPVPPQFLKPLPPRPPIRPLKRVTPQAEPSTPRSPAEQETSTLLEPVPPPPASEPQAPVPSPASPSPQPMAASPDALDSLEEEMAKLLGRGSGS